MKKKSQAIVLLAVILFLEGIFSLSNGEKTAPASVTDTKSVAAANNQFALEFYSEVTKTNKEKNIFFSPYSISVALAMTYEGARGKTADEIQFVFHFPKDKDERRKAYSAMNKKLNQPDAKYKLLVANAFWAQEDYKFLDEYITTLKQVYDAEARNLDFEHEAESARKTINTWVEDKTNDKIKDLIPPGVLDAATGLVLTNAIYFKGTWVKQFDKKETKDEDFYVSAEKKIKVPMMQMTDEQAAFPYAETEQAQILELLYEGEKLSMLVLLPKEKDTDSLEKSLTPEKLYEWKKKLYKRRVLVYLPRFKFESKSTLNEILKKMGMPAAFDSGNADFSGMNGLKELFIAAVIHKAFVDVNEEGTEAATATAVVMGIESVPPPPPVFRADHPFLFLIQDKKSGAILFFGRVTNPLG